ncbi:MAG: lipocalin-like domain-containing protein [Prevotella sp.]|nr:lipocalin-like domain-containing protein [Prevotella sp.]
MKRPYHILICICVSSILASCHIVMSDNGDLDGLWQLTTVEDLQRDSVYDGRDSEVTWAFQDNLLYMRSIEREVYCRFRHAGSQLVISSPYASGRFVAQHDDIPLTDTTQLNVFGIYHIDEYFDILQLDGSNMRLQSSRMRLCFRKY